MESNEPDAALPHRQLWNWVHRGVKKRWGQSGVLVLSVLVFVLGLFFAGQLWDWGSSDEVVEPQIPKQAAPRTISDETTARLIETWGSRGSLVSRDTDVLRHTLATVEETVRELEQLDTETSIRAGRLLVQGKIGDADKLLAIEIAKNEGKGSSSPDLLSLLWALRGRLAEIDLDFSRAQSFYEAAVARVPSDPVWIDRLALVEEELGNFPRAVELFRTALSLQLDRSSTDSPIVAIRKNNLARPLLMLGETNEALSLLQEALEIDEREFGKAHPRVAQRLSNIGVALRQLGRLQAAYTHFQRAVEIDSKVTDPPTSGTAILLNNLGEVLDALGRHDEALTNLQRALEIDQLVYGPEHPLIATDLFNIASVLRHIGMYEAARGRSHQALTIDQATFRKNHPLIARDLEAVAVSEIYLDQTDVAIPLLQQAQAINQRNFPRTHEQRLSTTLNLAKAYYKGGHLRESIPLFREFLDAKAVLDERDESQFFALLLLSRALGRVGDFVEGKAAASRALKAAEEFWHSGHDNVAWSADVLSVILSRLSEHEDAVKTLERSVRIFVNRYGDKSVEAGDAYHRFSNVLFRAGEGARAQSCLELAASTYVLTFGQDDQGVQRIRKRLAELNASTTTEDITNAVECITLE